MRFRDTEREITAISCNTKKEIYFYDGVKVEVTQRREVRKYSDGRIVTVYTPIDDSFCRITTEYPDGLVHRIEVEMHRPVEDRTEEFIKDNEYKYAHYINKELIDGTFTLNTNDGYTEVRFGGNVAERIIRITDSYTLTFYNVSKKRTKFSL